jgi:hypothetical protein
MFIQSLAKSNSYGGQNGDNRKQGTIQSQDIWY